MIRLTIGISKNAKIVRQGLQNLRAEVPKIGRQRMFEAMQRIVVRMQKYPPERPGQKYRRTFRFRAGWRINSIPDSPAQTGWQVTNVVPYAKYPVGNAYGEGQAWMHVGRWNLFRDVAEAEIGKLPKTIQNEVVMVARRMVGG